MRLKPIGVVLQLQYSIACTLHSSKEDQIFHISIRLALADPL